ncbi:MAG: glycosyltransferase, partial [Candidatus Sericytochromatia bacterium]|nr:glycosyltransferase [Candidatus Sericytochromatia bacterium]
REKAKGKIINLAVIIPFRDSWKMTRECVESILTQKLHHIQLSICLVNNNSQRPETQNGIEALTKEWQQFFPKNLTEPPTLHVLIDNRMFNFSELNNAAVQFLTKDENRLNPEYLLFLNNDTLFKSPDSLERLLFFASFSPLIGAVGCTLLYRNSNVQHLFLAPGVKLAGAHPCKGIRLNPKHSWYSDPRPVPAVTGALLLLATKHFKSAKGFDTALATSCQDLDLCLKLQELGLENWVLPNVFVRHFETSTRLKKNQAEEITYVTSKWGARIAMNRYYCHALSRWSERPVLSWGEGSYPWSSILDLMRK